MKAKKEVIDRAVTNGSLARVNRLLSAAHLLHCEANNLIEEATDDLLRNGLLIGGLKRLHNDVLRCYDRYLNDFATMITSEECKTAFFGDLDEFDRSYRKWAKIEDEDEPHNEETE